MNKQEALDLSLKSYSRYFNIKTEDIEAPFSAEAEFVSHNEQYWLVKAAKLADVDSNEFVFFALVDTLTKERLTELDKIAWERGLSRVTPSSSHRNTDVTLVIIADNIEEDAFLAVKKLKHYKSYKMSLWGWSNYKAIAMELSLKRLTTNRQGQALKKIFNNIINK